MCHSPKLGTQDASCSLKLACLRIIRSRSGLLSFYLVHSFRIVNILAFETLFLSELAGFWGLIFWYNLYLTGLTLWMRVRAVKLEQGHIHRWGGLNQFIHNYTNIPSSINGSNFAYDIYFDGSSSSSYIFVWISYLSFVPLQWCSL